jgi:hypothetical protein
MRRKIPCRALALAELHDAQLAWAVAAIRWARRHGAQTLSWAGAAAAQKAKNKVKRKIRISISFRKPGRHPFPTHCRDHEKDEANSLPESVHTQAPGTYRMRFLSLKTLPQTTSPAKVASRLIL